MKSHTSLFITSIRHARDTACDNAESLSYVWIIETYSSTQDACSMAEACSQQGWQEVTENQVILTVSGELISGRVDVMVQLTPSLRNQEYACCQIYSRVLLQHELPSFCLRLCAAKSANLMIVIRSEKSVLSSSHASCLVHSLSAGVASAKGA